MLRSLLALCAALPLSPSPAQEPVEAAARPPALAAAERAAVDGYGALAHHLYATARDGAARVREACAALVADPSEATLAAARAAWLEARDAYGPTEVLRFYGGPVDDPRTGPETLMNAWPVDEAYVDYVVGAPGSGIVGDREGVPHLDATLLELLNERGGEANVCVGWHAIEFALWGQDTDPEGPGARPHTDFVPGVGPNADRRALYLSLCADLLVRHLDRMVAAWAPDDPDNYRARFATTSRESARRALAGMTILSGFELAGERLAVAYETRDPEDEHSCFSDNTRADFVANQLGVVAVWRGEAPGFAGAPGVRSVARVADPELADRIDAQLDATLAAVRALPQPFDRALRAGDDSPERQALFAALLAFEDQAELLALLGLTLGHEIALVPGG